MMEVFL